MPDEITDASGKTTGFLKKKAGPLEVWQWGVGVVGLFAAYLAYKSFTGGGASTTASASPSVSTVPPSDIATTGANTALSGQLQDVLTGLGGLSAQVAAVPGQTVTAVQANPNPGSSSGATGGYANWQAFASGPGGLALADKSQQAFVTAQYQGLLGRAPDTQGLAFWESQLGSAPTQAQVTQENAAFQAATANELAARQTTAT